MLLIISLLENIYLRCLYPLAKCYLLANSTVLNCFATRSVIVAKFNILVDVGEPYKNKQVSCKIASFKLVQYYRSAEGRNVHLYQPLKYKRLFLITFGFI